MKYVHATIAVLLWLFVVVPYLLTFGRLFPPGDGFFWRRIGAYFNAHLPKP